MGRGRLESAFQKDVIDELYDLFPGCVILKNDASYLQGVPDLILLWDWHWATLEVKRSANEGYEPNQEYYIHMFNEMSFSAMICPENREEVIRALQQSFGSRRVPRIPQRQ